MKIISIVGRVVCLVLGLSVAMSSVAAEQEIDPKWEKFKTTIDFVSAKQRLLVVGDREFAVPFNTHILNSNNQPVAMSDLHLDETVLVYLYRAENGSRPEIKRIVKLK